MFQISENTQAVQPVEAWTRKGGREAKGTKQEEGGKDEQPTNQRGLLSFMCFYVYEGPLFLSNSYWQCQLYKTQNAFLG